VDPILEPIFGIVAAGVLGGASSCIAILAFYGYSKITGSKSLRLTGKWNMASLFLIWVLFSVVMAFTMVVYPGIDGLARVLHRLYTERAVP